MRSPAVGLFRQVTNLARCLRDGYRHRKFVAQSNPLEIPNNLVKYESKAQFPEALYPKIDTIVVQQHPAFCGFAAAQTVALAINCEGQRPGCDAHSRSTCSSRSLGGTASKTKASSSPYGTHATTSVSRIKNSDYSSIKSGASTERTSSVEKTFERVSEAASHSFCFNPDREAADLNYIYPAENVSGEVFQKLEQEIGSVPSTGYVRVAGGTGVQKFRDILATSSSTASTGTATSSNEVDENTSGTRSAPASSSSCAFHSENSRSSFIGSSLGCPRSGFWLPPQFRFYDAIFQLNFPKDFFVHCGFSILDRLPAAMKLPLLRSLLMYDGVPLVSLRQYFETQIRVATDQSFHSSENCSWGTLARAKAHKGTSTDGAAASSTTTQSQATTSSTQTNAVSGRQEISMHTSCSSSSTSSSFSYPISKGSSASSSSCAPGVHANVLPFVTRTEYISGDELGLDRGRFWEETLHKLNDAVDPFFVIISYSRQAVGQKHFSGGHVAPLGGYDPGTDRVLVLEVNSWRYPSCWIPAELLYQGIQTQTSVGIPRGMLKVFYDPKRGRGAAAGKMD